MVVVVVRATRQRVVPRGKEAKRVRAPQGGSRERTSPVADARAHLGHRVDDLLPHDLEVGLKQSADNLCLHPLRLGHANVRDDLGGSTRRRRRQRLRQARGGSGRWAWLGSARARTCPSGLPAGPAPAPAPTAPPGGGGGGGLPGAPPRRSATVRRTRDATHVSHMACDDAIPTACTHLSRSGCGVRWGCGWRWEGQRAVGRCGGR